MIVDADDPAFSHPTKFIGPVYDRHTAELLGTERGWRVAPDGRHWRRVVPSPEPRSVVELATVRLLVDAGVLVVCVGAVERDHGTPEAVAIATATPDELLALELPAGSMGPKVEAAASFVRDPGGRAAIGGLAEAAAVLAGRSGTTVVPAATRLRGADAALKRR